MIVPLNANRIMFALIAAAGLSLMATDLAAQEAPKPAPKMASGATAVSETYDDWVLNCQGGANGSECALMQILSQQNGQRVLTFSLSALPNNGTYMGSFILPFGLELSKGVTVALNEEAPSAAIPFKTCLPAGCIVPLTWSTEQYTALRAGNNLKITAQSVVGEPFALTVSLKGLSAAGKRALEIAGK